MELIAVIKLSVTSCYLLKGKNGYLLIDCGNERDKKQFLCALNKLALSPADIFCFLLTHHHNDHCGLLHLLCTCNPDMIVIMSEKCSEYLKTGYHHHPENEHFSNPRLKVLTKLFSCVSGGMSENFQPYYVRTTDKIIKEEDNTILSDLGLEGKLILTPGHTEDSLSLVCGSDAFVGDAARNMLNFTGSAYLPLLLYSEKECYNSWKRLIKENVKLLYPGHGKPFHVNTIINHMPKR